MVDTVRIGGIKLSGELVQLDLLGSTPADALLVDLLKSATAAKINIPHLHQGNREAARQTTLCFAADDFHRLQQIPALATVSGQRCSVRMAAGTLTLFPHGCNLAFIIRIIMALERAGITIHGISTSVSALVVHIDFAQLERSVEAVLTMCRLPENHTPLRPVVVLDGEAVETAAVYWEPKIRIYGMEVVTDLRLLRLEMPAPLLRSAAFAGLATLQGKFRLLLLQKVEQQRIGMVIAADLKVSEKIGAPLQQMADTDRQQRCFTESAAELVCFHGPHFQDRYGIAEMCYSEACRSGLVIEAVACTGTSVHFATVAGQGRRLAECLQNVCTLP